MTNGIQYQILIWSVVLIAVASLGLPGVIKSRRPLLYPGLMIFIIYFMGYGLPGLRYGFWGPSDVGLHQWPDMHSGLAFVSLFLLFLWLGFFYGPKFFAIFNQSKIIKTEEQREWSFYIERLPLLISATGFVVYLFTNYNAGGTMFQGGTIWESGLYNPHITFVTQIGILTTAALLFPSNFLAGLIWGRTKNPTLFLAPLLNVLFLAASSTSRGTFAPIAYFFAAAYLASPDPRKLNRKLLLAGCVMILGLIMMMSVRQGGWGHAFSAFSGLDQSSEMFQQRTGGDAISSLNYAVYFRGLGYGDMGFFKWLFSMAPLPSFLEIGWTKDYLYSVSFGSILNRGIGSSGWPCPANGELYLQMGWPGALVGVPLGMGLAKLWRTFESEKTLSSSPLNMLLYASTIQGFITAFHSPIRSCTRFFIYCLLLWAVLRIFNLVIPVRGETSSNSKYPEAKSFRNKYIIEHLSVRKIR